MTRAIVSQLDFQYDPRYAVIVEALRKLGVVVNEHGPGLRFMVGKASVETRIYESRSIVGISKNLGYFNLGALMDAREAYGIELFAHPHKVEPWERSRPTAVDITFGPASDDPVAMARSFFFSLAELVRKHGTIASLEGIGAKMDALGQADERLGGPLGLPASE